MSRDKFEQIVGLMSDVQLAAAVENIRGNPKHAQRRPLRLAELQALAALYREQERRGGVAPEAGGAK